MVATDIQSPDLDHGPIAAPDTELTALREIAHLLGESDDAGPKLLTTSGEAVPLPPTLLRIVRHVARQLARDQAVVVESIDNRLTPHQAAEVIGVPIQHVIKLLDDGQLPFVTEGIIQWLARDDVLAYRDRFRRQRREALREMTRLGQEWGMYDFDYSAVKLKRLAELDEASES